MLKSIKHFAKLCVLKGNPADVDGRTPTLVYLFLILLVLDPGIVLATIWMSPVSSTPAAHDIIDEAVLRIPAIICTHLFVALCIYVVLHVRNVSQNFRQTFSSYLGVNVIITLVSVVLIVAVVLLCYQGDLSTFFDYRTGFLLKTGFVAIVVALVFLVSSVWKILAFGYILFKSMELKFWQGGIFAILLIYAPEGLFHIFPDLFRFVSEAIRYFSAEGFS